MNKPRVEALVVLAAATCLLGGCVFSASGYTTLRDGWGAATEGEPAVRPDVIAYGTYTRLCGVIFHPGAPNPQDVDVALRRALQPYGPDAVAVDAVVNHKMVSAGIVSFCTTRVRTGVGSAMGSAVGSAAGPPSSGRANSVAPPASVETGEPEATGSPGPGPSTTVPRSTPGAAGDTGLPDGFVDFGALRRAAPLERRPEIRRCEEGSSEDCLRLADRLLNEGNVASGCLLLRAECEDVTTSTCERVSECAE